MLPEFADTWQMALTESIAAEQAGFAALLERARADPDVLGMILSGSHALGLATPHSDYDVRLIVRDEAGEAAAARYPMDAFPNVDLRMMTLSEFGPYAAWDTPFAWDRYSFAHAQVLVDRTGEIGLLVADKGRLAAEQQAAFARGALDAFINSVYRSLKCTRKGNPLCARLEASEAIQHGLAVIFALEGRLRPYPVALAHELRAYPLQTFSLSGDELLELIGAVVERGDAGELQRLFSAILAHARENGYGEVIDAWGNDIAWMQPSPA